MSFIAIEQDYKEGGHWHLTSPDLPGLFLAGKDITDLYADVPNVIKTLFRLNYGMEIDVQPAVGFELT